MHRANLPTSFRRVSQPAPRKIEHRLKISAILLAMIVSFAWLSTSQNAAEQNAMDYVTLNGYGSPTESFAPGEVHFVLQKLIGNSARHFAVRRVSVCMPPEHFTDTMIDHLLVIRGLNRVYLYVRDDPESLPGSKMVPASIEAVKTPASRRAIERFKQRYPHAEIIVPARSNTSSAKRGA